MPWDGTELRVGDARPGRHGEPARAPCSAARTSRCCSRSGPTTTRCTRSATAPAGGTSTGWPRRRRRAGAAVPAGGGVRPAAVACSAARAYAPLADGRLAVLHGTGHARARRARPGHRRADRPRPAVHASGSAGRRRRRAGWSASAASPRRAAARWWRSTCRTGTVQPCCARLDSTDPPDPAYLPEPRSDRRCPGRASGTCTRTSTRRRNPDARGARTASCRRTWCSCTAARPRTRAGDRSTWRTPTSPAAASASSTSTTAARPGYGRAYRERLRGQWGIVDVEDCVAAAQALVRRRARRRRPARHPRRLGRRLDHAGRADHAPTSSPPACRYYGVAELRRVRRGHPRLRVPLPRRAGRPAARGPGRVRRAGAARRTSTGCPARCCCCRGSRTRWCRRRRRSVFARRAGGEGHPARVPGRSRASSTASARPETIVAALEAELSFYGQVFGFDPPGVPALPLTRGHEG